MFLLRQFFMGLKYGLSSPSNIFWKQAENMGIKSIYFPDLNPMEFKFLSRYELLSWDQPGYIWKSLQVCKFEWLKKKPREKSNLLTYLLTKDNFKWSKQFQADFQVSILTVHTLLQLVLNTEQLQCEFM